VVMCLERGANCLHMVHKMTLHNPSSLALFRPVLPFWYQLTQVVLEKRPLNLGAVVAVKLMSNQF